MARTLFLIHLVSSTSNSYVEGVQTAVMYLPHSHHDGTHVTTRQWNRTTFIGTSSVSADDLFPQMDSPDQPLMTAVDDQQ
jgi:hypothetical protein